MRFKAVGNKRDLAAVVIKNNDAQILFSGAPCALDFAATSELGAQVKTVRGLATAELPNFFGINISPDIANLGYGEAQVFGYNPSVRIINTTRVATTDTWASIAAGSIGEILNIDTGTGSAASQANQCLVRAGLNLTGTATVTGGASSSGIGTFTFNAGNVMVGRLAETFASTDTQASSLGPQSRTVWTTTRKIFLARM